MLSILNCLGSSISVNYIYKMKPNDYLILYHGDNKVYSVIEGTLIVNKCFSNNEMFTTNIVSVGGIISPCFYSLPTNNYFYMIEAISISYIIGLSYKKNSEKNLCYVYNRSSYISPYSYHDIEEVLIHKTVKHRLIHLLLVLSQMCGVKHGNKVYLKVILSYKTLSCITGTSENTISKLIRYLTIIDLIKYREKRITIHNLIILSRYHYR
uniref:global nitrogen transcriptional regulator n=1 Tax=Rhodochorton tenue TaxID=173034 RepID=UPI002A836CA2|nr:global nitrogen transcriptional regulator [Rhodochorton tenue]WOK79418.1 global nitrogen transcriptional regulator [Rhodochorton tenue]